MLCDIIQKINKKYASRCCFLCPLWFLNPRVSRQQQSVAKYKAMATDEDAPDPEETIDDGGIRESVGGGVELPQSYHAPQPNAVDGE